MAKKSSRELFCSFCKKSQKEVRKLIAGPSVYICDECVELCNDIISDEMGREEFYTSQAAIPKPKEIKEHLDQYIIGQERAKQGLPEKLPAWQKSLVSSSTGAVGAILGCPADVALVRMQADTTAVGAEKRNYKGIIDAIMRMVSEEGVFTLWRGTLPLVARGAAMNLGQMASYDTAKEMITDARGPGLETNLLSAAVSGFFAAFTSLPFDMMKSRCWHACL